MEDDPGRVPASLRPVPPTLDGRLVDHCSVKTPDAGEIVLSFYSWEGTQGRRAPLLHAGTRCSPGSLGGSLPQRLPEGNQS